MLQSNLVTCVEFGLITWDNVNWQT